MRCIIVLCAALLVCVSAQQASAFTAGEMYQFCKPLAETSQVGARPGMVNVPRTPESGICMGTFQLLQEVSRIQGQDGGSALHLCLPVESTMFQLVQVYVVYAAAHPEAYHRQFFFVMHDAMTNAFPCPR
jgi:hypothetical protein